MIFNEKINLKNVEAFRYISYKKYEDLFITGRHKEKYDEKSQRDFYNKMVNYCKLLLEKQKPESRVKYKYGVNQNSGRIYPETIGLQSCSNPIKKFFIEGCGYKDYDIKNAHFCILQNLAVKNGWNCRYLKIT